MAIADDISVASNGDIRYTGTTVNHDVLAFHRFLQTLADDETYTGNDILDITKTNPSERSTDNIITLKAPYNIDDTLAQHLYDGSITQEGGDVVYSGLVVVGSVVAGTQIILLQNNTLLSDYWGTGLNEDATQNILLRLCIKTRSAGSDIDGKRLIVMARELGDTYAEYSLTLGDGNATAAIFTSADLNNETLEATISGWTTITNTEGYRSIDVEGDAVPENFYSEWNRDIYTINQLYERTKWLQRRGTASTLYGLGGGLFRGITHEVVVNTPTGTFVEPEGVSWTGGTGQLLAINSTTAPTKMWIQLLTGVAPTNGQTITGVSTATCVVNVTVTPRTISPEFFGQSTGVAVIGAYGLGVEALDLSNSDKLFDLDNNPVQAPNNVQFDVTGHAIGDYLLVSNDAPGLDTTQLSASGAYAGGETTFTVQEAIPLDTPSAGSIRCWNGSSFVKVTYTGWGNTSDFTGCTGVPAMSDGDDVFISYIDKVAASTTESFTAVYTTPRTMFARGRWGGASPIKSFDTTGALGTAGGGATIVRTPDE